MTERRDSQYMHRIYSGKVSFRRVKTLSSVSRNWPSMYIHSVNESLEFSSNVIYIKARPNDIYRRIAINVKADYERHSIDANFT